jgi:F420-0:gamma-glutamyl ligase
MRIKERVGKKKTTDFACIIKERERQVDREILVVARCIVSRHR